jgi:hypothetical protein
VKVGRGYISNGKLGITVYIKLVITMRHAQKCDCQEHRIPTSLTFMKTLGLLLMKRHVRSFRGAECDTDQSVVVAEVTKRSWH